MKLPIEIMINVLYFRIDTNVKAQIEDFSTISVTQKINFHSTDDFQELTQLYIQNNFDIIFIDSIENKVGIIDLFKNSTPTMSKLFIFSSTRNDAFDFVNYNIFGFLSYPLSTVDVLTLLNRCLNRISLEKNSYQLLFAKENFQKFISINSVNKIELIQVADISYFEADGRYTILHLTNGQSKMASKNLGEYQKLLNPGIFCRIHHKYIINMNQLRYIIKSDGYYCEMTNNKNVPVSKRKLENLNEMLNAGKGTIQIS